MRSTKSRRAGMTRSRPLRSTPPVTTRPIRMRLSAKRVRDTDAEPRVVRGVDVIAAAHDAKVDLHARGQSPRHTVVEARSGLNGELRAAARDAEHRPARVDRAEQHLAEFHQPARRPSCAQAGEIRPQIEMDVPSGNRYGPAARTDF